VEHYAGIGVSLELSSVCVVDGRGKIVKEAKVASEPEALVYFLKKLGFAVKRIGLEAGPLSATCGIKGSRVRNRSAGDAAREGGIVGDDREDGPQGCVCACTAAADGMVPAGARQIDGLLVGRKQLLGRLLDVELSIRGILRVVKKMSPAESREPGMRWCARHSMKLPTFCCRG
jgi:transposase